MIAAIAAGSIVVVALFVLVMRLFRRPAKEKVPAAKPVKFEPTKSAPAAPVATLRQAPAPAPLAKSVEPIALNDNSQFAEMSADGSPVPAQWIVWRDLQLKRPQAGGVSIRSIPEAPISGLYQRTGRGLPLLAPATSL